MPDCSPAVACGWPFPKMQGSSPMFEEIFPHVALHGGRSDLDSNGSRPRPGEPRLSAMKTVANAFLLAHDYYVEV